MIDASLAPPAESQPSVPGNVPLSARRHRWRWAAPAAVFLLGFAARIAYINHESVGHDESFSMTVSLRPLGEMIRALVWDFVHPPLHYFLLHCWFKLFGFGVLQARLLSAAFGTLAVVLLYFFAEYLFDRSTALVSSLLMAVSQLAIWLAQESRPYAQLHFLALLSSYLFVRALREGRALYWWGFVGSSIVMLYTHYYGVFVIAALAVYAVVYRKRYRLRHSWVIAGAAIALAAYLPWLASGVVSAAANSPKTFSGAASWHAAHWLTILVAVNSFNNGKTAGFLASSPRWTFIIGGLLFSVPMALAVKKQVLRKERAEPLYREGVAIAAMLWLLPLCVIIGLGFALHAQYDLKYVSFCAAPYYLLVGRGISELPSKTLRWGLLAIILAYSANSLRANYFMRWKEDWRDAFAYVESNRQEGDCGTFLPFLSFVPGIPPQWTITRGDRPSPFRVIPKEGLPAGLSQCGRIWTVSWAIAEGPELWEQAKLESRPLEITHAKIDEKRYFGVRVSLYSRKER
jgi:4-amino-4-deoxy-L-arabinose transferase-like glycosyltransferase